MNNEKCENDRVIASVFGRIEPQDTETRLTWHKPSIKYIDIGRTMNALGSGVDAGRPTTG